MVLIEKAILVVLTLDATAAIAVPLVYYASLRAGRSRAEQEGAPPRPTRQHALRPAPSGSGTVPSNGARDSGS